MKKYLLLLFLFSCHQILAQSKKVTMPQSKKCDCTNYPFRPDSCVNICGGIILKKADKMELALVLGLDDSTITNVVALRQNNKSLNLANYQDSLSTSDYEAVVNSLNKLNQKQLEYFNTPEKKKKNIIAEWKKLDLNRRPS